MIHSVLNSERGFATLIALIMLGMLTLIGLAAISTSDDEVSIASNELQEMRAFYAAEAGLERMVALIQHGYDSTGLPPTSILSGFDSLNLAEIRYKAAEEGPATQTRIEGGPLDGFAASIKTFTVTSIATSDVDRAKVELSQKFETATIPIFQWAYFFNDDLWSNPTQDMVIDGKVHVNKDMHLRSANGGTQLEFKDNVTAGGNIHAGFPGGGGGGSVSFADHNGNQVNMKQGGNWIDSDNTNWYDTAASLWDGRVQDASFGQEAITAPGVSSSDPHDMIERGVDNPDSYEHDAGLKIINGQTYITVNGLWTDISASLPEGTVTDDAGSLFFDAHENKWVRNTQIDMALLQESGYFPDNGIIYVSDQRHTETDDFGAILNSTSLINGETMTAPMTLATENPLYIQGDFNVNNKVPVSTISDAITFLSNNWDRELSDPVYGVADREASNTMVNLSFVTGDLASTETYFGGGMENLPRFLEDWGSTEFAFHGSMTQMWHSQQAVGAYRPAGDANPYYNDPRRDWTFDPDLTDINNMPPGTPSVRLFFLAGWEQRYVSYSQHHSADGGTVNGGGN